VHDDGVGADAAAARGGLVNMRDRAERRGGEFTIERAQPGGTRVCWSVPLRD
jgi:signal transduction histidine kinase